MRPVLLAVLMTATVLLGACAGEDPSSLREDEDAAPSEMTETPDAAADLADGPLPPPTAAELAEVFADRLDRLGLALTERSALIDRQAGYGTTADGDHLALYVVPVDTPDDDDVYANGVLDVTAAFADVFELWPELASFDVCQELPEDDPRADGITTVSLVELSREAAMAIEWDTLDLVALLELTKEDEASYVRVFEPLRSHPAVQAAFREAGVALWGN